MKLFDWILGKRYLEWDEYKEKIDNMKDRYWDEQSKKKRFDLSK
jgi:hypothetical protein